MDNLNFRGQAGISSAKQQRESAELGIELARKSAESTLDGIAQVARLREQRDELLAALKLAKEWLEGWASAEHELSIINAAIAKAEGKGDE